jgi:hypothetical protein
MTKDTLSNKPKHVRVKDDKAAAWYYEEPTGLELIVEVEKKTGAGQSYKDYIHVTVPWRSVVASVKRYTEPK